MRLRLLIEIALPLIALLLAGLFRWLPACLWSAPSRVLRLFAPNGRRAIVSSAVLTVVMCAVLSWARFPRASIHDEFAYLVTADTFAHGRLTNPPHPMWQHFESFHLIQRPSYQAKYPPAQGLSIAAGQVLTGHPIAGVWIGMAAAAAAVCWMLLAWVPPRWALLGGLMPALRFGTAPFWDTIWFGYWSTTYWGGAVALAGGALLFGALPRLMREPRPQEAVALALGVGILANSRPYEGIVVVLPTGLLIAGWMLTHRAQWKPMLVRAFPAAICVLGVSAAAMGYYNYRVTGDPLKPPYIVYSDQYDIVPLIAFQPLKPDKTYNHPALRALQYGYMLDAYNKKRAGFGVSISDFTDPAVFFLGYALLPALFWLTRRPWNRWLLFALAVVVLSILANKIITTMRLHYHYLAPAAPWIIFLAVEGLRRARLFRLRGRRLGRPLTEAMLAACLLSFVGGCIVYKVYLPRGFIEIGMYRTEIEQRLNATPGKDLVIVQYDPARSVLQDWVYNGADLDGAPILWARDLGQERNRELFEYYSYRRIWVLNPFSDPPDLHPLPNVLRSPTSAVGNRASAANTTPPNTTAPLRRVEPKSGQLPSSKESVGSAVDTRR